jgi:hypothetical protein
MELIDRQAAIDALDEIRHALWEIDIPSPTVPEYVEHHEQVQSVWKLLDKKQKELYLLPSAQPEQRYTEEELRVFQHGISLSLLSKRSSQYWQYDEDTATQIKFLERLDEKVDADMRGEQDE